ncbi:MAG TPA: DsrE family protein [Nitrospiria bacterium]|jgi:sulfur relay (sulfurtransferase) complex TusBCD TusD component (DsrE family)
MKIGVLLLTSPEHENTITVQRLCKGFLTQGHSVEIFFMEDGVFNCIQTRSQLRLTPPWEVLTQHGVKISLCTQTFEQRGLKEENLLQGAQLTNQHQLARMVASSDRFLVFG